MKQFDKLEKFCNDNNLEYDQDVAKKFYIFYEQLIEQNKVMNLTAVTEFHEVEIKHFIDSLESAMIIKELIDFQNSSLLYNSNSESHISIIDIGTGAGFPGLPLAIEFPEYHFILADSLNKRVKFLKDVTDICNINNVTPVHGRAEDLAVNNEFREQFDICVSRAVASMPILLEYCLPFVKIGGFAILYKSGDYKEELESSKKALKILGGEIFETKEFELPDTDIKRSLIVVSKVNNTPKKYPRKAGTPKKDPLL